MSALVKPAAVASRWYVLGAMTAVYALSIADRYVVSTLIEPIKADLRLSDTGVATLTGVSLAIFYVIAGLPLARVADRTNRRDMISIAIAAWSVMTVACGLTHSFWQCMLARIGVGVGEAGGTPPAQSLLSDYFPWRARAFAMSVFSIGAPIGSMLGSLAGYISDVWGWRTAFFALGVPGVLLAVVLRFSVDEPKRGGLDVRSESPATLRETFRFVIGQPALLHAIAAASVWTLWSWGLMWWLPALLTRSHHMTVGEAGGAMSLMHGIGGTAVLIVATIVMGRLKDCDPRVLPWLASALVAVGTIPSIVAVSTSSTHLTLAMLWIFVPLSYALFGPVFALIQNLAPASMRAQATAVMLFTANIANLVIAPEAVGIASDHLAGRHGADSLRLALIPLACTGFWAAYHFFAVATHIKAGLARAGSGD
jgi:MFS family permease